MERLENYPLLLVADFEDYRLMPLMQLTQPLGLPRLEEKNRCCNWILQGENAMKAIPSSPSKTWQDKDQ